MAWRRCCRRRPEGSAGGSLARPSPRRIRELPAPPDGRATGGDRSGGQGVGPVQPMGVLTRARRAGRFVPDPSPRRSPDAPQHRHRPRRHRRRPRRRAGRLSRRRTALRRRPVLQGGGRAAARRPSPDRPRRLRSRRARHHRRTPLQLRRRVRPDGRAEPLLPRPRPGRPRSGCDRPGAAPARRRRGRRGRAGGGPAADRGLHRPAGLPPRERVRRHRRGRRQDPRRRHRRRRRDHRHRVQLEPLARGPRPGAGHRRADPQRHAVRSVGRHRPRHRGAGRAGRRRQRLRRDRARHRRPRAHRQRRAAERRRVHL